MVSKVIGYILSMIALVGLFVSFDPIAVKLGIKLPLGLTTTIITIASVIILIVGLIIIWKSGGSQQPSEVPIYHGKHIVGYRRMSK